MRTNLTQFTLRDPLWASWCDFIRVLIRVLPTVSGRLQRSMAMSGIRGTR
jgi:hypothetical protein